VLHGPSVLLTEGLNVKRFPCCYEAQRAADAALLLRGRCASGEIERITVTVHPGGTRPLVCPDARSGQDARFSAQYVVAAGLLDGTIDLDSFTDAAVRRPQARFLMERITVEEAPIPPVGPATWADGFAVVTLRTVDGTAHAVRVDIPAGHARSPLGDPELARKATDCLRHGNREDAPHLVDLVFRVAEDRGLARLLSALRTRRPTALAG
jgi:2-methylcitrate dehydratase PrpD